MSFRLSVSPCIGRTPMHGAFARDILVSFCSDMKAAESPNQDMNVVMYLDNHEKKDKLYILEDGPTHLGVAIALDAIGPLILCSSMELKTAVETCRCNCEF